MSRSKKRSTDELEELRTENRELKSVVKSLQRQLRKLEKDFKPEYEQEDLIKEDLHTHVPKCKNCGKGKIKETQLGAFRTIITCTICDHKVVKKHGS